LQDDTVYQSKPENFLIAALGKIDDSCSVAKLLIMTIYFYKANELYGCFSNFSPHGIQLQATHWPTVEHYYQSQKFVGTADAALIPLIHAAPTPAQAAALGRDRTYQVRPDWEQVKLQVMREAVLKKFLTHTDIAAILISTGNQLIVENSQTDYYWGWGEEQTGQNHLGKILMSVRHQIRQQCAKGTVTLKSLPSSDQIGG
jgi:ribA/ribD-fused uncharacterized protein